MSFCGTVKQRSQAQLCYIRFQCDTKDICKNIILPHLAHLCPVVFGKSDTDFAVKKPVYPKQMPLGQISVFAVGAFSILQKSFAYLCPAKCGERPTSRILNSKAAPHTTKYMLLTILPQ